MNVNFITSTTNHIIVALQLSETHPSINKQGTIYTHKCTVMIIA
jgi:hypothetical protein